MILRIFCVFSVTVFSAEALPFSNMNLRPASLSQTGWNFPRRHSAFYPLPRLPDQRSPLMFSGHPSSPIRQPALQLSDILNRRKEKFDNFIPSRSTTPSRVFLEQYLSDIHQQTAQEVWQLGQRGRDMVQHHKKYHRQKMQHVKEMLDHFRRDDVKNRLKHVLLKKQALMNKLHSIGWRGKYVGVPYHTMNDDHMIVKKPSANFSLLSQPNIGIPIVAPVPAVQPIATQHPDVPEVTTSVDLHQESDVPATVAGHMFPITSVGTHTPEVTETTEIMNSIGQDKLTKPQLPSDTLNRTGTTLPTTMSTDHATENINLEADTTGTPFIKTNESIAEVETILISMDALSRIPDEDFGSVTIDRDATTEIGSTLFYSSARETTTETPVTRATMLIDLLSRNKVKPIASLVTDVKSTTAKIDTTFPSTITIVDDRLVSSINDSERTIDAIISTFPFTPPTETTSGTEETSLRPPALDTTAAEEMFGNMDTAFTSLPIDPDSTSETISTEPSVISTGRPMVTDPISTTISTAIGILTIDRKMTTEIASTLPSTMSTEKTSWPLPASEITPFDDVLFSFEYNNFPNLTDEVEIATEVDATFLFTTHSETNTMVTERLTTVESAFNDSTIEVEGTMEIISTFPSALPTEITTTLEEISAIPDSAYVTSSSGADTMTEIVSTPPSTLSPEITSWPSPALELNSLVDVSYGFGYNRFPSSTDHVKTNTGVVSTFSSMTSAETNIIVTERPKTVDLAFDASTIEIERIPEIFPTFPSIVSDETTTILEDKSTSRDSPFDSSTTDEVTTEDVLSTFSSTIPTETTIASVFETATFLDALPTFEYHHFADSTNAPETNTGVDSILLSTIPTDRETTTMVIERLTTIDLPFDSSTIEMEIATENISTLLPTISSSTSTNLVEIPITVHSAFNSSTSDGGTTSKIVSTLPSTIFPETTSWFAPSLEISSLPDVLSKLGYNRFPERVEKTTEVDSSFPSTIPAEISTVASEKLTTVDSAFNNSTIGVEGIMEELSTTVDTAYSSSTSDAETTTEIAEDSTSWPPPALEITPLVDVSSRYGYNHFPSFIDEVETTTEVVSTFSSTTPTEKTITVTDRLINVDPAPSKSTIEIEGTIEIVSTFPSAIPIETTTTLEEISTIPESVYISFAGDAAARTEIVSTLPSTLSPEITSWPSTAFEITSLADVSSRFGYNRFPSFTDQVKTTTGVDSTFPPTISTETNRMVTEKSKTVDLAFGASTIEIERTTETSSTFSSLVSAETTTISEEKSISTDSPFGNSTTDEVRTEDVLSTLSSAIPAEATIAPVFKTATLLDALPTFEYHHFTDSTNAPETSSEVDSILLSTIPTDCETTTMAIERLTTVASASDNSTIKMEITRENVSELPSTISTSMATILDEISTIIDPASIGSTSDGYTDSKIVSTLSSTIPPETTSWPAPALKISPLPDLLSDSGYNRFPSFTEAVEQTTEVDATFPSIIPAEVTTMATETLGITVDPGFIYSIIDTEQTTEILPMFPSTISAKTTSTLEEILTRTPLDSSSIDDETTMKIISTFTSTFPTTTQVSEFTTLLNVSPKVEYNRFTGSTIAPETAAGVDSLFSSTISTETTRMVIERLTTSSFENSIIDMDVTSDIDSLFPSSIKTKPTTTLEDIFITTGVPFDNSTITEGTTVQHISTVFSTEPTTSLEEISRATNTASNSSTNLGETTAEIVSTLPTTISTEITAMSNHKYDSIAEKSFEYFEENRAKSQKRNSDSVMPRFAHTSEKQSDEKILLNLIPLIIEELRQDNVTPEEEHTFNQVFGDLWPLLKEESKRKQGEPMNNELAIFLFEAGQ